MNLLSTDNRDMTEIETELRARIEVQRIAIELEREENQRLRREIERLERLVRPESGAVLEEPRWWV